MSLVWLSPLVTPETVIGLPIHTVPPRGRVRKVRGSERVVGDGRALVSGWRGETFSGSPGRKERSKQSSGQIKKALHRGEAVVRVVSH